MEERGGERRSRDRRRREILEDKEEQEGDYGVRGGE